MISIDKEDQILRSITVPVALVVLVYDLVSVILFLTNLKVYKHNPLHVITFVSSIYAVIHCLSVLLPVIDIYFVNQEGLCKCAGYLQVLGMVHIIIQQPFVGARTLATIMHKEERKLCKRLTDQDENKVWMCVCLAVQFGCQIITICVLAGTNSMIVEQKKCWIESGAQNASTYVIELFSFRLVEMISTLSAIVFMILITIRVRAIKRQLNDELQLQLAALSLRRQCISKSEQLYVRRFIISTTLCILLITFNNILYLVYREGADDDGASNVGLRVWYQVSDMLFIVCRSGIVAVYSMTFWKHFFRSSLRGPQKALIQ